MKRTVIGSRGKRNVLLCAGPDDAQSCLVFFPGDLQDFEQPMRATGLDDHFIDTRSLEATADRLSARLPAWKVVLVAPARHTPDGQSEFDHLLAAGWSGCHLSSLLLAAGIPDTVPLHIAAFSKGCLVANTLMAEFAALNTAEPAPFIADWESHACADLRTKELRHASVLKIERQQARLGDFLKSERADQARALFARVAEVMWVDAHAFPSNPAVAGPLAGAGFLLRVFTTPRQLAREAVRGSLAAFVDSCKRATVTPLLAGEAPNNETHFRAIDEFQPSSP